MSRIRVSLTNLIDFTLGGPNGRYTNVMDAREFIERSQAYPFDPKFFYRPLVDQFVTVLRGASSVDDLDRFVETFRSQTIKPRRYASYRECADGFLRWVRSAKPEVIAVNPRPVQYFTDTVELRVNPELLVRIDGELLLVKLYLKRPVARKATLSPVLYLMNEATRRSRPKGSHVAILDVRRGALRKANRLPSSAKVNAIVELAAYATTWKLVA